MRFLPRVVLDYSYYSYSSGINSVSIVSPATGLETKQSSFKPCVLGQDLALVVGELIRTSPGITYMYVEASGFPRHHHPDIFKLKAASHPMAYTDKVVKNGFFLCRWREACNTFKTRQCPVDYNTRLYIINVILM